MLVKLRKTEHELIVSRYFEKYVERGKPGYFYVIRHPLESLAALIAIFRLPCLRLTSSPASAEGDAVRASLSPRSAFMHVTGFATGVLMLPPAPGQYSLGASKQTLRRKVRQARRLGVRWAEVTEPEERKELLKLAEKHERTHPNEIHRNPNPDLDRLLSLPLWLAAYSADDRPLLLSVTPVDREFAVLSYFRTLGVGDEYSTSRYMMTEVLVDYLIRRGVRYLVDPGSPAIPNGLRHFQRMIGFRTVRIRTVRARRSGLGENADDGSQQRTAPQPAQDGSAACQAARLS